MAAFENFHSLHIDLDKGIYEVNGRNISSSGKKLHLHFEKGMWSLVVAEDTVYSSDPQIKE